MCNTLTHFDLSIIIPIYNAAQTLGRTLQSLGVIDQAHRGRVEVLLVNDGSTDNSKEIALDWIAHNHFDHARLINTEQGGSSCARNAGLGVCLGGWIFFLDADDELAANPLPYFEECPNASAILFSVERRKSNKAWTIHRPPRITATGHMDVLTASNPLAISTVVFKKTQIDNLFDQQLLSLEDWFFWLTNPRIFESTQYLPHVVSAIVHAHGSNKSTFYTQSGQCRKEIAQRLLVDKEVKLTRKQANNLAIQRQIGHIQCGRRIRPASLLALPCAITLWLKLLLYGVLHSHIHWFDFYGRSPR